VSLRLRLTLWYTGFLAVVVMLLAPAFYVTLESEFLRGVDRQLIPVAAQAVANFKENPRVLQGLSGSAPGGGELSTPWARRFVDELDQWATSEVILQLMDTNGKIVAVSSRSGVAAMPVPSSATAAAWWNTPTYFSATVEGMRYRSVLVAIPGDAAPRGFVLAARPLTQEDAALERLRNLLIAGSSAVLLLVAGVAWFATGRGLRPIEEITRAVHSIALAQGF